MLAYWLGGEVIMEQGSWSCYWSHFLSTERGETHAGSSAVHDETGRWKTTTVYESSEWAFRHFHDDN